jgi:hypothetical protein
VERACTVNTLDNLNTHDAHYNPPHDGAGEDRRGGVPRGRRRMECGDGVADRVRRVRRGLRVDRPPLANGVHVVEARAQTSQGVWTTTFDSDEVTVTGSPVDAPVVAGLVDGLRVIPNPARDVVELAWRVDQGPITVSIVDVGGRVVFSRRTELGEGSLVWAGRDAAGNPVAAGVYWVRLSARSGEQTRRLVWMR